MEKINLKNTTFMIPIRLDSQDREFNFKYIMNYLLSNFDTNIMIIEQDKSSRCIDIIDTLGFGNSNVTYHFEHSQDDMFHRTRLLNEMIHMARTPIVVNYDADVFMLPEAYAQAVNQIINGSDLVYPYFKGLSQIKVEPIDKPLLGPPPDFNKLFADSKPNNRLWQSAYGHCCFFKSQSYIEGGMENEGFCSYGAEDVERYNRFVKLGYKVEYLNNYVFHIEHSRGANSSSSNPFFKHNEDLFRQLHYLDDVATKEYYKNQEYLKKYTNGKIH